MTELSDYRRLVEAPMIAEYEASERAHRARIEQLEVDLREAEASIEAVQEPLKCRIEQLEAALRGVKHRLADSPPWARTWTCIEDAVATIDVALAARKHANCAGAAKSLAGETGGDT